MSALAATVTQPLHQIIIVDLNLMEAEGRKIRKMAARKTIEARGQLTMAIQHLLQIGNSEFGVSG